MRRTDGGVQSSIPLDGRGRRANGPNPVYPRAGDSYVQVSYLCKGGAGSNVLPVVPKEQPNALIPCMVRVYVNSIHLSETPYIPGGTTSKPR